MRATTVLAVTLASLALLPAVAVAGIVTTSGAVSVIAPPASVNSGAKQSNSQVFAFAERQNVALPAAITLDISVPGTTPASAANDNFSTSTLPAGTIVSSYFLHCDAVGSPSTAVEYVGSITFDRDILGLIILNSNLNATAAFPGLSTTTYATNGELEINKTAAFDSVTLSADRRTVSFDFRDASAPDDIRVITTAVPEPSTGLLLALGMAVILWWRRSAR